LPEIARSWPRSVAGALPNITEALLSLGRSRSCINITSRTVELIRHVAVVEGDSTAGPCSRQRSRRPEAIRWSRFDVTN
jgi:hypothetical protein